MELYFDFISPFAYYFFKHIEREPLDLKADQTPTLKPVVFGALLRASGNKGPAEIPRKRQFTYEYCTWYGAHHGIPFLMPSAHPFNPVRYLRLAVAQHCAQKTVQAIFDVLWTHGGDPASDAVWQATCDRVGLSVAHADALIAQDGVKNTLRSNTEEAVARGIFGVPTVAVGEEQFWGADALPMLRDYLRDPAMMVTLAMRAARASQVGVVRKA